MIDRFKRIQVIKEQYTLKFDNCKEEWPIDVQRVYKFVHEHLFESDLNVSIALKQCCISNKNFSGKFKHYVGHGLKNYILHLRIEASKEILGSMEKEENICCAGFEVGFISYSAFSRSFSKAVGMTPKNFKEKIEEN
ncbi:MAG: AraC family transcriptional regulator [Balneola sp.]|nr:MAG: AraC family transcriptional regulator [Balneola sp.]